MNHNKQKNQSIERHPEIMQVRDLVDKNIKKLSYLYSICSRCKGKNEGVK